MGDKGARLILNGTARVVAIASRVSTNGHGFKFKALIMQGVVSLET
jgi:hypothetical protein